MQWWDHTKPFPDTMKTGCPDTDKVKETIWKRGYERHAESLRDAQIKVIEGRATGHDIKIPSDPWLYEKFPELTAMENFAESSFLDRQRSGKPPLSVT